MFKYLLFFSILFSYLQVSSQIYPTRAQLQLNNATGYNNQGGAFRTILYMPLGPRTTPDSGAIAFQNNNLIMKRDTGWVKISGASKINDSTIVIGQDTLSITPPAVADPEWVSVTDYGAVPNDLANDYTTNIQAALNSGARCVLFPAGQYKITAQVKVKSNTSLFGYGAELIRNASIDNILINDADGVTGLYAANTNIHFYGLTFNGNRTNFPTPAATTVAIGHANNISFVNCEFLQGTASYHHLELNAVQDALVEGCYIHDGIGAEFIQLDVAGGPALFPWFGPVDNTSCNNIVVNGNVFADGANSSSAFGSHSGTDPQQHTNIVFSNNVIRNFGTGNAINMYNYRNLTITGNTVDGAGVGVTAYRTGVGLVQNWVISNNQFNRITNGALNLFNIKGISITGNNIDSTGQFGISIANSRDVNITSNVIRRSGSSTSTDWGSLEISTDTNIYVVNNTFLKNPAGLSSGLNTAKVTNVVGATIENNTFTTPNTTATFNQFTGSGLKVGTNVINGTVTPVISSKTSNYTYVSTDGILNVDASAGNVNITVNPSVFNKAGLIVRKTSSDVNTVTITPSSGTINGVSSISLVSQNQTALVKTDFVNLDATITGDYLANNGITKTNNLFKLGGNITERTFWTGTDTSHRFVVNGVAQNNTSIFSVTNNWIGTLGSNSAAIEGKTKGTTGIGIKAIDSSTSGSYGILSYTNTGYGMASFVNNTGTGLLLDTRDTSARPLYINMNTSQTEGGGRIYKAVNIFRTGAGSNHGQGTSIAWEGVNYAQGGLPSLPFTRDYGLLVFKRQNMDGPDASSQFEFHTMQDSILKKVLELDEGRIRFSQYGINTYAGTPAYGLGVDASGNVVEYTPGGGADGNGIYGGSGSLSGTTVITGGSNTLTLNGTQSGAAAFSIANTGNGNALSLNSTGSGPAGIMTNTGTGHGLDIISAGGVGLNVSTDDVNAAAYIINPTSTNTVDRVVNYIRKTQGTAANNMGGSAGYQLEDDAGLTYSAAQIKWIQTNAATASRTTAFTFSVLNAGTSNDRFSILGSGQLRGQAYGASAFPTMATTYTGFDGSGNMVERLAGFRQTQTINVTANDNEATLIGTGAGSLVIPANTMAVGKTYRITLRGTLSTDASNPASMNWRIKFGTTEVLASGNMGIGASRTNVPYDLKAEITCRSTGALGTVVGQGMVIKEDGPGAKGMPPTVTFIDTTVSNTINVTIDMTDGSAGNNVYAYILIFEEI